MACALVTSGLRARVILPSKRLPPSDDLGREPMHWQFGPARSTCNARNADGEVRRRCTLAAEQVSRLPRGARWYVDLANAFVSG